MCSGAVRPVRRATYSRHRAGVGVRGSIGYRLACGFGEQVRPGPRYDLDQLIPSAAGEQPAPAGQVVGERMDRGMSGALRVDAQLQAGQRIQPVRVGPVLADQDLRPEPAQQRRDDRDRKKDLIIRGGYNIYPREIEEVLYEHPAVREAAVIGLPHPQLGGEVGATVVLNPGASVTAKELRDHVKKQVAAYKYPRTVWIVDALPKGPTGKILKREIVPPGDPSGR